MLAKKFAWNLQTIENRFSSQFQTIIEQNSTVLGHGKSSWSLPLQIFREIIAYFPWRLWTGPVVWYNILRWVAWPTQPNQQSIWISSPWSPAQRCPPALRDFGGLWNLRYVVLRSCAICIIYLRKFPQLMRKKCTILMRKNTLFCVNCTNA